MMAASNANTSVASPTEDFDLPLWTVAEDVPFLGYRTTHRLRDAGYHTVSDIMMAPVVDLEEIEGVGPRMARRLKVLVGDFAVIEGVGEQTNRTLLMFGITGEEIMNMNVDELMQYPNIGQGIAEKLVAMMQPERSQ